MAKELPYFKFEPNQWENGNIQMCSRDDKGLFMDLCSMYWSRLGDLPLKLAIQKLCAGNATALDSLCANEIITVIDGMICIDFLNEQLSEFQNVSDVNRENALLGWKKRRKDATAKRTQSERNAIREDEIRKEEIRVDESALPIFEEQFLNNLKRTFPYSDFERHWQMCYLHHSQKPNPPEHLWQWANKFQTWLSIATSNKPKKQHQRNIDHL